MSDRSSRASAGCSTGVLPVRTTWVAPRTEAAGLAGHHLPDHQPIAQPTEGGQVLLDRGRAIPAVHLVDVGGHGDRRQGRRAWGSGRCRIRARGVRSLAWSVHGQIVT